MQKFYKVIIAGNFHNCKLETKADYMILSTCKKMAIDQLSKRYEKVISIKINFLLIRTIMRVIRTMFKSN
jgi:hypothetical protein